MLPNGSGVPPEGWDALLDSVDGHVTQSRAWARFHAAQGDEMLWGRGDAWCWLGVVRRRRGFRDLYLPYGPAYKIPADLPQALTSAVDVGRQHGVDMVRIEPWEGAGADDLRQLGAAPTQRIQPQDTWLIDLTQSEEDLFTGLSANRRRDVRSAERKGLRMWRSKNPEDVRTFLALLGATAERGHFNVHPDSYYEALASTLIPQGHASLYFAGTGEGHPVAGIFGLHTSRAAYYAHAAADQERSRTLNAPGPLAWRMILDAKREGCVRYDFWGVAPEGEADHPWAGLSRFKRGFGGTQHRTAGTWDVPINKPKYLVYRAAKRVFA